MHDFKCILLNVNFYVVFIMFTIYDDGGGVVYLGVLKGTVCFFFLNFHLIMFQKCV